MFVVDTLPSSSEVKVGVASDIDSEDRRGSLLASLHATHVVVKPSTLPAIYLGTLLPESVRLVSEQDGWVLVGMPW